MITATSIVSHLGMRFSGYSFTPPIWGRMNAGCYELFHSL